MGRTRPRPGPHVEAAEAGASRVAFRRLTAALAASAVLATLLLAVSSLLAGREVFAPALVGDGVSPLSLGGALVVALAALGTVLGGRSVWSRLALVAGLGALATPLIGGGDLDLLQALTFAGALAACAPRAQALAARLLPVPAERVIVVGSGEIARRAADALAAGGIDVVGSVDDSPLPWPGGPRHLGATADLVEAVRRSGAERLVVAFSAAPDTRILDAIRACDALGVRTTVIPRMFDLLPVGAQVGAIGNLTVLDVPATSRSRVAALGKRALDLVGAACLLALTAPVMAMVAAAIALDDGAPVLFRQRRVGRGGRPFHVLKFRTMVRDADARGDARIAGLATGEMDIKDAVAALKQEDDPRITRVGRFLRKTSLDELPQLVNVLRGEMSLVGPRPLRDFEVDRLSGWERARNDVQPGVTGLWQVSGRSDVDWLERMQLDYRYVRHWSLGQDLRILLRTVPAVLGRRGAV